MKNVARSTALLLPLLFALNAGATTYNAILNGPSESPPNASDAFGVAQIKFDTSTHVLMVEVAFVGLDGTTTASHIHCCTATPGTGPAGVATELPSFTGFPLGVTSGAYSHTFDTSMTSTWNPSFLAAHGGTASGAEAAFDAGLMGGSAYLNIHSTLYPGGEIRGFLMPVTAVPEPASLALLVGGIPVVGLALRRRQKARQERA